MADDWKLLILDQTGKEYQASFEVMENLMDPTIPVEDYVPRKQAEAVYLSKLLERFSISPTFTHVLVQAIDGLNKKVTKEDADQAFLVFKHKGERLTKGFPARLYVPGNESDCLNVKSVVQIELLNE